MEQPLPAERHRRIQELVRDHHVVRVSVLSDLMGVSEVTIRRDLEALERRGLLERTHGGAVATRWMHTEPGYVEAISSNPDEKRAIGRAAAAMVVESTPPDRNIDMRLLLTRSPTASASTERYSSRTEASPRRGAGSGTGKRQWRCIRVEPRPVSTASVWPAGSTLTWR